MKAYKGFNKDMTCRGFQFKEGETYTEDKAELCKSGFHACEHVRGDRSHLLRKGDVSKMFNCTTDYLLGIDKCEQ